ncbi:MAG: phasin family protein, partial [Telluria sp.]
MTSVPEQFSAVRNPPFHTPFDFFNSLAAQALESASRVVALNLSTSRDSVQRSLGTTFALLNSRDPRDFLTLGGQTEEQVRRLFAYSQELFGIASGIRPFALRPQAPAPRLSVETVDVAGNAAAPVAVAAPEVE